MNSEVNAKYIYLYRHGETDWNINGITMGQLEGIKTEFTQVGYQDIFDISESLKKNKVEVIYSSDFNRTVDTANLANCKNGLPIIITKGARGLNMGKYQGLDFQKFIKSEEVKRSFENYDIPFPGGESINQLNNRLYNFIVEICNQTSYERIAIVTHSAAISNLKAFISKEKYISLKMCSLIYKDKKLIVFDYTPVKSEIKNKQKVLVGVKNETL